MRARWPAANMAWAAWPSLPRFSTPSPSLLGTPKATPRDRVAALGRSLAGRHVLITSGPTQEPIDPVRYIANRSSGKQGHALARAAAALGAEVTLVSGPVTLPDPPACAWSRSTPRMRCSPRSLAALPADIAICAAAVADWRAADEASHKLKKQHEGNEATLKLTLNPDILATLAKPGPKRPRLVIGFAAETENLIENAKPSARAKGADWIVANDVWPGTGAMGGDRDPSPSRHAAGRRGLAGDQQGRDGRAAARPRWRMRSPRCARRPNE